MANPEVFVLDDWTPNKVYEPNEIDKFFSSRGVKNFAMCEADIIAGIADSYEYITFPVYIDRNDGMGKRLVCFATNDYMGG